MFKRFTVIAFALLMTGCQHISNIENSIASKLTSEPNNLTHEDFIAVETDNDEIFYDISRVSPTQEADPLSEHQVVYGDIWKRIQSQLHLPIAENRRLKIQRAWYANHPEYLNRVAKRAEPFLYYIVEEIEKRELPMELALLPIVESAFDPFAYSHGRASGLWQFVPGTAERFGLAQNWWYDGRRDVIAATKAALDYLEKLHQQFDGNWLHALAAYNSGEGRVARAIQKNYRAGENIDFWSLELPKETDAYVPKLLALADIVKRPHKFNIQLYSIANVQIMDIVETEHQIDLALAADMAGLHINELHALNPGYNRWATAPDGPHRFLLPLENAQKLAQTISNKAPEELITWQRYQIKSGDTLSTIAQAHQTTVDTIKTANKIKGHTIRRGDYLLIPTSAVHTKEYKLSAQQRVLAKQSAYEGSSIDYTVKKGDTFWDISKAHKVNVRDLAKWNSMAPGDPIYPGQKLKIKVSDSQVGVLSDAPTTRKVKYKVRRGDSLARIAQKFKVSISDIESWNKISRRNYLQPGQMLNLHVDVTQI
ncbi:lytic transglycosylase [Catenovulum sediminis]|uniref:LysM peptidoglycan-binding domain-containing protein n=1 Tax=Catenovulum sediminis TaxID=1740262 RepID=A0ABV1RCF0_9ALTE|nr:LysM peptidoglycan-binding domain-containing protein [Catenovulum sediminis]